jgi:hypothetical protein
MHPDIRYVVCVATTRPEREPTEFSRELSRHLRDFMEEHEITVEQVAADMGRSRSYVSDHTNGLRAPETDLLNHVANLAHTNVQALMLNLLSRMTHDVVRRK